MTRNKLKFRKILIIHHGEGLGGGLIALIGLIDELKVHNEITVLAIFNSSAVEKLKETGVKVMVAKTNFYKKYYRLFIHSEASYFSVADLVRTSKNLFTYFLSKYYFAKKELLNIKTVYDTVYLNSTFISDWSRAGKSLGKSTIIHVREPLAKGVIGFRKAVIKTTIKKYCGQVIAISHDNANRLGLNDITEVIYDPVVINARMSKSEIFTNPGYKYFTYVGGMQRIKGFEQLVHSLPYLNSNVKIFFLGPDYSSSSSRLDKGFALFNPYLWRIKNLILLLKKSDRIIYIGLSDNIFNYYLKSLAIISPFSKPHASLPILEAFAVGKPVIASDIQGMDELIRPSSGILFKNNNPRALANAINKMAQLEMKDYITFCDAASEAHKIIYSRNISVQNLIDKLYSFESRP